MWKYYLIIIIEYSRYEYMSTYKLFSIQEYKIKSSIYIPKYIL